MRHLLNEKFTFGSFKRTWGKLYNVNSEQYLYLFDEIIKIN